MLLYNSCTDQLLLVEPPGLKIDPLYSRLSYLLILSLDLHLLNFHFLLQSENPKSFHKSGFFLRMIHLSQSQEGYIDHLFKN